MKNTEIPKGKYEFCAHRFIWIHTGTSPDFGHNLCTKCGTTRGPSINVPDEFDLTNERILHKLTMKHYDLLKLEESTPEEIENYKGVKIENKTFVSIIGVDGKYYKIVLK